MRNVLGLLTKVGSILCWKNGDKLCLNIVVSMKMFFFSWMGSLGICVDWKEVMPFGRYLKLLIVVHELDAESLLQWTL
jgi:hypothetical protein